MKLLILIFSGFNSKIHTQTIKIRDGTKYEEFIGVKRFWTYPHRDSTCTAQNGYYDLTIMELGESMQDLFLAKPKFPHALWIGRVPVGQESFP